MFGQFRDKRKIKIMGSNLMFSHVICRVLIWGVFHCRCERTQTQQAQYNEFGREASSRTGHLRGLCQWSGRIVGEQDRQRRRGGVKVYPRARLEDEFLFSSSDTT